MGGVGIRLDIIIIRKELPLGSNKGSLTVSDSKSVRRGLKPALQVVYMWICDHTSDGAGRYPSRIELSEECGMTLRSLDRTIVKLEGLGLISRESRFDDQRRQLVSSTTATTTAPKTKSTAKKNEDPEIGIIMRVWETTTGLKLVDNRKSRDYARRLLKQEGKANILDAIAFVHFISGDRYAPRVTDLEKLYYKWNELMLYSKKKKAQMQPEEKIDLAEL